MICSSEFSFDENSVWDPKAIRQLLIISEDQLNILNNIPEWTKETDNYYSRIRVNDSCINTQVETNPNHTLPRNQEVINHNTELFNKDFDSRENTIQAYKLNALKFSKSISLFEIDKISSNSHCVSRMSSALSLPNVSVLSKELSPQFENKSYLCKESFLSQLNLVVVNTGKSKTCVENLNMEVVSQLPVVVPQIIKNSENFAIVDKTILSTSQAIQSSDNSSNSSDLLSTLADVNKSDHLNSVATKETILDEIDKLDSSDRNDVPREQSEIIANKNDNLDLQENIVKLAEPTVLNLKGKMGADSSIVEESIVNDVSEKAKLELEGLNENKKNELQVIAEENINTSSVNKDKYFNINVEHNILNEVNETSVGISKQPMDKELPVSVDVVNNDTSLNKHKMPNIVIESKTLIVNETSVEITKYSVVDNKLYESKVAVVSSDELKSKITENSYDSRIKADFVLKTACQGAGDGEAATSQSLPLKRKSESKARSSKRSKSSRDKQGCSDKRSIKKAGEICYSPEDTKIMFDLLKLFL